MAEAIDVHQSQKGILRILVGGPTRKAFFENYIIYGDLGAIVSALILFIAVHYGEKTTSPWILIPGIPLIIWGASGKFFKSHIDRFDKSQKKESDKIKDLKIDQLERDYETAISKIQESHDIGLEEGADIFYRLWAEVARRHEDGMENANRQLQSGMVFNSETYGTTEAFNSYLKAIISTFSIFFRGENTDFSASLSVLNGAQDSLELVKIEPGGANRSSPLPRSCPITPDAWGMVEALREIRIVYTPDVRVHGSAGDRGYLSVVNMPVKNPQGRVIAVVNVDSPFVDAFVSEERVKQAYGYCLPIISSISLSLSDPRAFNAERS